MGKEFELTEQDISDIMLLNAQGYLSPRISDILDIPYHIVLRTVKENNGVSRRGKSKADDGTSIKEQAKALWESGLHNIDVIAERLNSKHRTILVYLNCDYNIKTRPDEMPIDFEAEKIAKKMLSGDKCRGEISALARKYNTSRQYAHQRVVKAKQKVKGELNKNSTIEKTSTTACE